MRAGGGWLILAALLSSAGAQNFDIITVAGGGSGNGDGRPALEAKINEPGGPAVGSAGNVYIADRHGHRIRRVDSAGTISTAAGTGEPGFGGDGGPAAKAQLNEPTGTAVTPAGVLYIVDSGNDRVRRVDVTGMITAFAGSGEAGFSGDGGPAAGAALNNLAGVAVDAEGRVLIADQRNHRVRRVDSAGVIRMLAGTGLSGESSDGRPAVDSLLSFPGSVAADSVGNIYIGDQLQVSRVDAFGRTHAMPQGARATAGGIVLGPRLVAVDDADSVYLLRFSPDANARIDKMDSSGEIRTFSEPAPEFLGGLAVDAAGNVYLSRAAEGRVDRVGADGDRIEPFAGLGLGRYLGDGGPAADVQLEYPGALAIDAWDNLCFTAGGLVRRVEKSGVIHTLASSYEPGQDADGSDPAPPLTRLGGLEADRFGNLLVAHRDGVRIVRIDASGSVAAVAGTGEPGFEGDGRAMRSSLPGMPPSLRCCILGLVACGAAARAAVAPSSSSPAESGLGWARRSGSHETRGLIKLPPRAIRSKAMCCPASRSAPACRAAERRPPAWESPSPGRPT